MATAIKITFTTPSGTRGARVKATALGGKMVTAGYDHSLTLQGNAEMALDLFLAENPWGEYSLGNIGDSDFVAVQVPRKFIKARDAVLITRRAISQGEHNGNPHCKAWGQAITDLTDGVQPDGFSSEYSALVMKGL